jgi:hypothetical protein
MLVVSCFHFGASGPRLEKVKLLRLAKTFLQLHHTEKVMSKEQADAQIQEEDDAPDEWYIISGCQSRPKPY